MYCFVHLQAAFSGQAVGFAHVYNVGIPGHLLPVFSQETVNEVITRNLGTSKSECLSVMKTDLSESLKGPDSRGSQTTESHLQRVLIEYKDSSPTSSVGLICGESICS